MPFHGKSGQMYMKLYDIMTIRPILFSKIIIVFECQIVPYGKPFNVILGPILEILPKYVCNENHTLKILA